MWFVLGTLKFFFLILIAIWAFIWVGIPLLAWTFAHAWLLAIPLLILMGFFVLAIGKVISQLVFIWKEQVRIAKEQERKWKEWEEKKLAEGMKARLPPQ
jgi:hypothetical protein